MGELCIATQLVVSERTHVYVSITLSIVILFAVPGIFWDVDMLRAASCLSSL
ncbi:hypothetical protein BABINDRAFT_159633 [Babjeviella inositovora NRRL Y-12698]|uniref:Uncharacterized protein n=1 Tax=Babjeviella inositovora NRRL Y-12698 TaxID=984486 RepID=A0A1E3QZU3_9ASCO|nr:uncharacterized protein BABINDRAFT_159633 [Babjeviella inositovora NRRL Y-12698]ODQ83193.1 hypothetical protein BABINDRAFT_159633 [Babjeviella inositovora NRRL Y-12698]